MGCALARTTLRDRRCVPARIQAMTARLATHVWVGAYLARLQAAGIAVYVAAKVTPHPAPSSSTCATLDGRARAVQRIPNPMTGTRRWDLLAEGDEPTVTPPPRPRPQPRPRPLGVEIEDRQGRTLLDEPGLAD